MDEEVAIINEKTRNEKIRNFITENKKLLILGVSLLVVIIIGFYTYQVFDHGQRESTSDKYNTAVIEYNNGDKAKILKSMKEVIKSKDSTYSPLALYFLIDNNLVESKDEVNQLFDVLIKETSLEDEIKNLIIYKKALFFADYVEENELLEILNPLIKTESVWSSHALYLLGEYYFSKNEKRKSKEFFNKIQSLKNVNQDIQKETQKRLNRDFSE